MSTMSLVLIILLMLIRRKTIDCTLAIHSPEYSWFIRLLPGNKSGNNWSIENSVSKVYTRHRMNGRPFLEVFQAQVSLYILVKTLHVELDTLSILIWERTEFRKLCWQPWTAPSEKHLACVLLAPVSFQAPANLVHGKIYNCMNATWQFDHFSSVRLALEAGYVWSIWVADCK